jgi:hypothetical protein
MSADRYDRAYRRGYADGYARAPKRPPRDDADVNYRDGYDDGAERRRYDEADGTVDERRYIDEPRP